MVRNHSFKHHFQRQNLTKPQRHDDGPGVGRHDDGRGQGVDVNKPEVSWSCSDTGVSKNRGFSPQNGW